MQTLLECPYSPGVQSHASSVRKLKIPSTLPLFLEIRRTGRAQVGATDHIFPLLSVFQNSMPQGKETYLWAYWLAKGFVKENIEYY